jgi:hypothetical protein
MHCLNLISQLCASLMATIIIFAGFLFVDDTDLVAFLEEADVDAFSMAHIFVNN